MTKTKVAAPKKAAKKDAVKELFSKLQSMRRTPDTSKRPNKIRAEYIRDMGSLLTRYNNVLRRAVKAEAQLAKLAE